MANVTMTIDDEALRRARIKAVSEGTSVNALFREFIDQYVDAEAERQRALEHIIEIADRAGASSGPNGRTWTREDLYDRPSLR
ncbi:MAG: hypothetical protein LBK95_09680 [Bifidobacteriaceae bacterium]|nr:hypothetical protein [Bifidobacteriaceae bacterium]